MIDDDGGGEVWLVEKNNKRFAIKIPKVVAHQTLSYNEIKDFLKKAELWSKLDHPKNVLFKDGEPKIGDWGIARILLDVTTKTNSAGTF